MQPDGFPRLSHGYIKTGESAEGEDAFRDISPDQPAFLDEKEKIEAPMQWRTPKLPVNAGSLESGCVQNRDYIVSIGAALEILVSPGGGVQEEPAGGIRQKGFGLYFRVDHLGEHITEDEPKNI